MISSKFWLVIIVLAVSTYNVAQVGIGTTNPKAVLDINSASSGILMPRLTTEKRKELKPPNSDWEAWEGMLVYDINLKALAYVHEGKWHILRNN